MDRFFTLNLCLVDPRKKERFGDAMVAVIEVLRDFDQSSKMDEVDSLTDSQLMFDQQQFYSQNQNN